MNLLTIKTSTDNTVTRTLLNYPTEDDAIAALHYELWYAASDENVLRVVCEVISDEGRIVKYDDFLRETVAIPEEGTENVGDN